MNDISIPIIILNWKGLEDTRECIASLLAQNYKEFKIYLVDNGSETLEVTQLRKLYANHPQIKLISNQENLGFAKGNNRVIESLVDKYKYIGLLNNDTTVEKDWLENLVKCTKETGADMITSKMINYYNRELMDNAGHIMLNTGEILPLGTRESIKKYCKRLKNHGACAGACLYSSKMLKHIGLFDEFFHTGYEDAELGVRAKFCGYSSVFEPKAVVYHKGSISINKIRDLNYAVKLQTNIYYTIYKLFPISLLIILTPLIILKTILIIFVGLVTLRTNLYKSQTLALKTIFKERKQFKLARQNFARMRILDSLQILKLQYNFLPYYFKYFYRFILCKEKTVFESK